MLKELVASYLRSAEQVQSNKGSQERRAERARRETLLLKAVCFVLLFLVGKSGFNW